MWPFDSLYSIRHIAKFSIAHREHDVICNAMASGSDKQTNWFTWNHCNVIFKGMCRQCYDVLFKKTVIAYLLILIFLSCLVPEFRHVFIWNNCCLSWIPYLQGNDVEESASWTIRKSRGGNKPGLPTSWSLRLRY